VSYISWAIKIAIFVLLLGFAFQNSAPVTLQYWFGYEWRAPLVLILMAFLVIGILVGLFAALGTIFRLRRQIHALKKELKLQSTAAPAPLPAAATPAAVSDRAAF
jgi:uncharacterized integral membrane protein